MLRRTTVLLPLMALLLAACSGPEAVPSPGGDPTPTPSASIPSEAAAQPTPEAVPPGPDFPKPHANFARHFTDPLYSDEGGEFAPFGTDEGSDTLAEWKDRRSKLTSCTTLRWMLTEDDMAGAIDDPAEDAPDIDGFIIGAGFSQILLTGHIDTEGKQATLDALKRTYAYYADVKPREIAVMIRDLNRFEATDCTKP